MNDDDKPRNPYEERQEARRERYEERAAQAERNAAALANSARERASVIPFGQPILVGHHSEKRDRRYRERIHNTYMRAAEESDKAAHYRQKAAGVGTAGISSDDPEADDKIAERVAKLERKQELMRATNKIVKRKRGTQAEKVAELVATLGYSEPVAHRLFEPDFCGRIGFPDYALTNNSANIRRLKQRLVVLERASADETTETKHGEITVRDDVDLNRVQIFFPGKPSDEIRAELKSSGFRWARSEGAWQRHRGSWALQLANQIAAKAAGVTP